MDRDPIHVDVADLLGNQLEHFYLVIQLNRSHATANVTFELQTPMPGASRIYAHNAIALCCQHVHP